MLANLLHILRKERLICEVRTVGSSVHRGRVDPTNLDPGAGAAVIVIFRRHYPAEFAFTVRVPFLPVVAHPSLITFNNQYFT